MIGADTVAERLSGQCRVPGGFLGPAELGERLDPEALRAWLAGLLWPDTAESQGLATLRRYLAYLRRALGSEVSRKYQPLATQPWSRGKRPVVKVDCTEQVTAGVTVRSGRIAPWRASAARFGVCSPTSFGVSPTTFRTRVRRTADY